MYTVYQHKNKVNGKMYFGITGRNPEDRFGKDGSGYQSSPHFYSAIQKYGWDAFEHNILYEGCTKEQACELEKMLILKYRTQDRERGYNVLEGGDAPVIPPEIREKMSLALRGNTNGAHPCADEAKRKISAAIKGKPFTEEHKQRLSEAAKRRKRGPCSEETKKRIAERHPRKRPVYCFETDTVYESVHECARRLHLQATNVSRVCKGERLHSTGGYHLAYYDTINA